MTPLIAVTGRRSNGSDGLRGPTLAAGTRYCDAITRAGGAPIVVGPSPDPIDGEAHSLLASRIDGLVLSGGGDIEPARYGGPPDDPRVHGLDPDLDAFESSLLEQSISRDIPVLAICRGMQLLNVVRGGSLHLDLADAGIDGEVHRNQFHRVRLVAGSRLHTLLGRTVDACHSYHHQAVDAVGGGLEVTGRGEDGTIEAIELGAASWVVGVQWHPEDTAESDRSQQAVFDGLVRAARARTTAPPRTSPTA